MKNQIEQVYSFETSVYKKDFAHGADTEIFFSRCLTSDQGEPYNFVDFVRMPPGSDIALHRHARDNQEIYIIISGQGRMLLDGREFPAQAGALFVNRPGGEHGLINVGQEELRMIVLEVPV